MMFLLPSLIGSRFLLPIKFRPPVLFLFFHSSFDFYRLFFIGSNITSPADVDAVITNDARGIGLFRSEFLYLGSDDFPTEEVQFEAYKTVVQRMNGARVIIRTMDIGADKKIGYFDLADEEIPHLA